MPCMKNALLLNTSLCFLAKLQSFERNFQRSSCKGDPVCTKNPINGACNFKTSLLFMFCDVKKT